MDESQPSTPREAAIAGAAPKLDLRDPDFTRSGIFIYHNCSRCSNGTNLSRCPTPNRPSNCGYPVARND